MGIELRPLPAAGCALWLLCCSARAQPPSSAASDAGFILNLPDAAAHCSDAGSHADAAVAASDAGQAPTVSCTPTRQRDFTTEIQPLFAACSGEVCHDFTTAGLLSTIGLPSLECCGDKSLIAAGAPAQSYLLDKLRGEPLCDGVRMPVDKPPLSDADIQAISDWICEGAPSSP